jgi:hypothetical protein
MIKSILITLSFVSGGFTYQITPLPITYEECTKLARNIIMNSPVKYTPIKYA